MKVTNFLWGLVLIVIGLVLGLNALGITQINLFFKGWWTLFIIVPCFIGLFNRNGRLGSFIGLIVGVFFLLAAQGLISFELIFKLIIPVVLIATGLSMIFSNAITSSINRKIKSIDKNNLETYAATFAQQNVDKTGEEFNGANLDAVFGGVKLDLQKANLKAESIINASAIFGGVTILVPSNANVKVKSTPIFGGVDNKVKNREGENVSTIYISAFSLFGGVEIK